MSNYPVKSLVLSHSSRSTFRRCARKFELSKMYGDPVTREEAYAGDCGNALHRGFQEFLISHDEKKAVMAFLLAFPYDMEYTKHEYAARSLEACYATLMELLRSSLVDDYELVYIDTKWGKKPAVEVPFAIEIVGSPMPIPVYFIGFMDAILWSRKLKKYGVADIKTTRMNIRDYSARYEWDEQTVPYSIMLEHLLGNPITELDVSYISAFIDLLEPKVSRYPFLKTQDHIQDWYIGLCDDIGAIARNYKREWFPRATNGETCMAFNKPCFSLEYCSTRDPKIIQRVVNTQIREGLFHDGIEAWITAKLEWLA